MDHHSDVSSTRWYLCGSVFPKAEIVYFTQVGLIYIVVLAAIVNLSLGTDHQTLWIALLSANTGILLPSPRLKRHGTAHGLLCDATVEHKNGRQHHVGVSGAATPPD